MNTKQIAIRITSGDEKNMEAVRKFMIRLHVPESDISSSSIVRFALQYAAGKGNK